MDSTTILTSLAAALTLLCVYYHIKVFSFWSSRGIKGPTPWPIFGTSIYYIFRTKIEVDLEWSEKYGRVYGIYEGYFPALRITDAKLTKHIFIKEAKSFMDRNDKFVKGENISRWLFFSKGDHWNNQRVLITPMFTSSRMRSMFQTMTTCADRFLEEVKSKIGNSSYGKNKQTTMVTREDYLFLNLDVISKAFFGLDLNVYKDKSSRFCEKAFAFASFDVIWGIFYFAIPDWIRDYLKLDLTRPYKYEYFDQLAKGIINDRKSKSQNGKKHNDFMQALIDAKIPDVETKVYTKEDDNEQVFNNDMDHKELEQIHQEQLGKKMHFRTLEDREVVAQATFIFLAGFETTSGSLSLILNEMAHNPDMQEEVYQELLSMGDSIDYEKLISAKKLNAFISESLRLHNPVTETSRVVTVKEGVMLPTEPNPIYLPYDTTISLNGFSLQRDPEYFPNPNKFDMTRFYPENKDKIMPATYAPFGLGMRNCAGMRFALLNLRSVVSKVLRKYKIQPGANNINPPKYRQHGFFTHLATDDLIFVPRQN